MSIEALSQDTTIINSSTSAVDKLKVLRRNGAMINFNRSKIAIALTKAFLDEEGGNAAVSSRVHDF